MSKQEERASRVQDWVEVADEPDHKEVFSNEQIRVYIAVIRPGRETVYHRHDKDSPEWELTKERWARKLWIKCSMPALDLRAFQPLASKGRVEGQRVLLETAGPPVLGKEVSVENRTDLLGYGRRFFFF